MNLGWAGVLARLAMGAVFLGLGVAGALALPRGWRLALVLPFWMGALGALQAATRT